jgi:hypothetical protein
MLMAMQVLLTLVINGVLLTLLLRIVGKHEADCSLAKTMPIAAALTVLPFVVAMLLIKAVPLAVVLSLGAVISFVLGTMLVAFFCWVPWPKAMVVLLLFCVCNVMISLGFSSLTGTFSPPAPTAAPAAPGPVGKPAPKRVASRTRREPVAPQSTVVRGVAEGDVQTIMPPGHNVQVWQVAPGSARAGRYELSIQHAAAGAAGAFYCCAWTDTNNDGLPDKEIGRSRLLAAKKAGQWSTWQFSAPGTPLYVGNCWSDRATTRIFYQMGGNKPAGFTMLGDTVFYSRQFNGVPSGKAKPRFTNIRVKLIDG